MPILRSSPASPFARKARIAALFTGAPVTVVDTDTRAPDPAFFDENPLGKIPVLVLDDGTTIYDSPVILDYLDHLAGGGVLIPTETAARFAALKLQALADGLMDAALLQVYEVRFRPEARRHPEWVSWQAAKVARALDFLEGTPPGSEINVGTIAVACALGYLDLRFDGRWRQNHARLVAWLDGFAAAVPAFEATRAV